MAKVFTDENFETEVLASDVPVLVDFWAEWCGPCKMIAPAINELSNEFGDKAKIGKLNIDKNNVIASKYGIRSIPSLFIFKGGQIVDRIVGAVPKNHIQAKLQANI